MPAPDIKTLAPSFWSYPPAVHFGPSQTTKSDWPCRSASIRSDDESGTSQPDHGQEGESEGDDDTGSKGDVEESDQEVAGRRKKKRAEPSRRQPTRNGSAAAKDLKEQESSEGKRVLFYPAKRWLLGSRCGLGHFRL